MSMRLKTSVHYLHCLEKCCKFEFIMNFREGKGVIWQDDNLQDQILKENSREAYI